MAVMRVSKFIRSLSFQFLRMVKSRRLEGASTSGLRATLPNGVPKTACAVRMLMMYLTWLVVTTVRGHPAMGFPRRQPRGSSDCGAFSALMLSNAWFPPEGPQKLVTAAGEAAVPRNRKAISPQYMPTVLLGALRFP